MRTFFRACALRNSTAAQSQFKLAPLTLFRTVVAGVVGLRTQCHSRTGDRVPAPICGKPMKAAPSATGEVEYRCSSCHGIDPLESSVVRGWIESPLKPPEN